MIYCNKCENFLTEDDLLTSVDTEDGELSKPCPLCGTDNFLMDVSDERVAPDGHVWTCSACGKQSQDLYGILGWHSRG